MIVIELTCLAIVAVFLITRARLDEHPLRFFRRIAIIAASSWVAEDTVIHAYRFYQYSPEWTFFLDRLPLMVALIWPVVIHSAWDLSRRLLGQGASLATAGLAALLVFTDASLIEPVAVRAGFWSWNAPGLFEVPPIGVLGWALFAGACLVVLHVAERRDVGRWVWELSVIVIAPAATHLLLLLSWWGLFKWIDETIPPWPAVGVVWVGSFIVSVLAALRPAGARVPLVDLALRIPAAAFFFVLLALHGADRPDLVAWVCAFAPPYLVLTARAVINSRRRSSDAS